jgi:hypothetical protein
LLCTKKKRDRNEQQLESAPGASRSIISYRQQRNKLEQNPKEKDDGISSSDDKERSLSLHPGAHVVGGSSIDQDNLVADNVENQGPSEEMIMILAQVVDPDLEQKAMEEEICK